MREEADSVILELPGEERIEIGGVLDPELRRRWGLDKPSAGPDDDEPVSRFNNFI